MIRQPLTVSNSLGDEYLSPKSYQATYSITSDGIVESGSTITFKAGSFITLTEGFYAESGSEFNAIIEDCEMALQTPPTKDT